MKHILLVGLIVAMSAASFAQQKIERKNPAKKKDSIASRVTDTSSVVTSTRPDTMLIRLYYNAIDEQGIRFVAYTDGFQVETYIINTKGTQQYLVGRLINVLYYDDK